MNPFHEDDITCYALYDALVKAASEYENKPLSEENIYPYMESIPKTSFIAFLGEALTDLGYEITKVPIKEQEVQGSDTNTPNQGTEPL
jgi:hypothetical protein